MRVQIQDIVYARGESGHYVKAIEIRGDGFECHQNLTQEEVDEIVRRLTDGKDSSEP